MLANQLTRVHNPRHVIRLSSTTVRTYRILAIESSCDDSSIAMLNHNGSKTIIETHLKSTLDSVSSGGIIPIEAHRHHQSNLPLLLSKLKLHEQNPDLVCVTRGPGMVGSLSVGLNLAKGISISLNKPLLGINHMLGHLLIPRLNNRDNIQFPLISLLVSGGHTILVHSKDQIHHEVLCETIDVAVGDALDKCGREIGIKGIMIGSEMEKIAKLNINNSIKMKLPNPLSHYNKRILSFSFASFITAVKNHLSKHPLIEMDKELQQDMAFQIQDNIFEHMVSKIKNVIQYDPEKFKGIKHFICSGGVSTNMYLRRKLEEQLSNHFENFHYPSLDLGTDNAVMIGWAGIELLDYFKANENIKIENNLDILPLRKWALSDIEKESDWHKNIISKKN